MARCVNRLHNPDDRKRQAKRRHHHYSVHPRLRFAACRLARFVGADQVTSTPVQPEAAARPELPAAKVAAAPRCSLLLSTCECGS